MMRARMAAIKNPKSKIKNQKFFSEVRMAVKRTSKTSAAAYKRPSPLRPIVVVGSMNMDLVCRVERRPAGGETVTGSDLVTIPGGKGGNQAVAAAKLAKGGLEVHMVGRVGDDDFGQRLLNSLNQHGVRTESVIVTEGVASGCAMIQVDRKGENAIIVAPGSNARLSPADIDASADLLRRAAVVIMQIEIPLETVQRAIAICHEAGVPTILDPAPARRKLPRELYQVDIFTPNQTEAQLLAADAGAMGRLNRNKRVNARQIGATLLSRGPTQVILKQGADGAMILARATDPASTAKQTLQVDSVSGFKVDVVDTTAAGDAFTGALAVALAEGMEMKKAVRFANAAGALCCSAFGAQPALPNRGAVEKLLRRRR